MSNSNILQTVNTISSLEELRLSQQAKIILSRREKIKDNLSNEKILKARTSLLDFTLYTKPDYYVNWHHKIVAEYLDKVLTGEIRRLMIFMPPQHGKSELASRRFPAYALGCDPNLHIIACSHSMEFSARFNREIQRIIDNENYREIFPSTYLNKSNVKTDSFGSYIRTSSMFEIVGKRGSYMCAGVGGSISGNPADLLILDDPLKGADQAYSPTFRDKVFRWYNTDFKSRRSNEDVPIIIIQTRWHEDDLAGRLLEDNIDNWTVLSLPAIKEDDDGNQEDKRNIGEPLWKKKFSLASLLNEKKGMSNYSFSALYQQRPTPESGGGFKRADFRYYDATLNGNKIYNLKSGEIQKKILHTDLSIFCTMDLATDVGKNNDFTVLCTWGLTKENDLLLLDMFRDKIQGAKHIDIVWQVFHKWKPQTIYIEKVQYQVVLIQQAISQGLPAVKLEATGNKSSRAMTIMAKFEAHKVFLPRLVSWLSDVEKELLYFPNGKYDDIVDCFAYAGIKATMISDIIIGKNYKNTRKRNLNNLLSKY